MKIERVQGTVSLRRTIESGTEEQRQAVKRIIDDVRNNGDGALKKYTEMFDGISLDAFAVTQEEIEEAYWLVDENMVHIIREAAQNIREYHERQRETSWFMTRDDGTILGQKVTPLDAVGLYVPGGTAAYPSSVLMNVIPAQVAGVKRIVIVSPPNERGTLPAAVLVAACELGVQEIYKVGGAQAIAALAYGTETIEPVDKIFGPGNIYVALAKREVFGQVDIDMIAGPSEIVVLADETAKPNEIAADLLSQAEHDERAVSILVTPSLQLALKVEEEVEKQLATLPRKEIAQKAINEYGAIYVTDTMKQAIDVVNELAPEHLEIMTAEPFEMLSAIRHAGAVFLGSYSSEPVGDYFAGTNHVLPTNGTARFSSGLTVEAFMKKSSIIFYSEQAWQQHAAKIAAFARLEGLEAHARAVEERLKRGGK
ncbi:MULTISPECIES: histidinol dehydrogenase [Anoxybacillus]|uniref:Histidinol dehydrogenase n=1 Tax=Anoxybacillus flavithermus TaxID=33934 RepID=A0A178TFZ8_9BACL|nr:histidinol dehydrogenase [Anoxybacillus flavithermus]ASA96889.1 histidinol dehydrogenase [Anoxybacillus flavithermus]ELK20952.1 histidinol dehydrogenase [Anoxybacillus flavithermus TNO-09.006]MBE2905496.1 histidinol dehydrogenase [Anoxybacillus flavithermus]MBE2907963.1 histidinol dehydrogenase [Anoxybacillus flavithermus]MBE2910623.1 histidinol dehydrogenase [Anoxybacillus flavithermus]